MSTVDEWAKREAERARDYDKDVGAEPVSLYYSMEVDAYAAGLTDLAALLLSDEALSAAVDYLREEGYDIWGGNYRGAIRAALDKITEDKE